jgi:putative ATPase
MALVVAVSALLAYQALGSPEGDLALALATLYNALSEKSNSAYLALKSAEALVEEKGDLSVPLHLRNPVTKLMEKLGYGRDYLYPHDFEEGFVPQDYLPEEIKDKTLYHPKDKGKEAEFKARLKKLWGEKKG